MSLREKIHRSAFVVAISEFGRSQLYTRSHYDGLGQDQGRALRPGVGVL